MDSPGLFDTTKSHEDVGTIIIQSVAGMHPGPNAVLYVIRIGRYTAEEYSAYNRLKALFDPSITKHMIVLFTGGDDLENSGQSIDSLVQRQSGSITTVLTECNYRYILFNNRARDPRPQVERLLDMVRQLDRKNGGPYVCPKYMHIGERLEAEVTRRMEEVDKKELERQKYVQKLQQQTEDTEKALSKTKEEMKRKEREQKRQVDELAKKQQQETWALKRQIEEQRLSNEWRLQEERALRERQEHEQRQMFAMMEQQRMADLQKMKDIKNERRALESERIKLVQDMGQKDLDRQTEMLQMRKGMQDAHEALIKLQQSQGAQQDADTKKLKDLEKAHKNLKAKLAWIEQERQTREYENQMEETKDEVVATPAPKKWCTIQ